MRDREEYKAFFEALDQHFPNSITLEEFMIDGFKKINEYDFTKENSIACVSVCRDEITRPLFDLTEKLWGEAFNFSSLGGLMTLGKTGFAAARSHAPEGGLERYVFIAMPHIAISGKGEIGICYREGREDPSHACGALEGIVNEIKSNSLDLHFSMDDIEQTLLKQKVFGKLNYGEVPDLVKVTHIAKEIVLEELENLIAVVDTEKCDYAVLSGVQIHGPENSTYIHPYESYAVVSSKNNEKISFNVTNC